jgi:hypothetical protein
MDRGGKAVEGKHGAVVEELWKISAPGNFLRTAAQDLRSFFTPLLGP